MQLPKARTTEIVENDLDKELLIYDLRIDKAYSLNETSKIVFKACSDKLSFEELKQRYGLTDDLIYLALDGLKKENLLEDDYVSPFAGINRREVIKKIGLSSLVALPMISSIVAPDAAHAASNALAAPGVRCASPSECQSGICSATFGAGPPVITPGSPAVYVPCPPTTSPGPPVNIGSPSLPIYTPGPPVTIACPPVLVTPATPPTSSPGPSTIYNSCKFIF